MSDDDWIELRTAALARPRGVEDQVANEEAQSVLRVVSAGGAYALDLRWLRGVRTLRRLARLPLAPPHVVGLVSHEGAVLPVFHLGAALGAPLVALPERGQALVLGQEGDLVAVAIDSIAETRTLAPGDLHPVPASVGERIRPLLQGVTEDGVLVLDTAALLAGDDLVVDIARRVGRSPRGTP